MKIVWYTNHVRKPKQGHSYIKHEYINTPETSPEWEYFQTNVYDADTFPDEFVEQYREYKGTVSFADVIRKVVANQK